MARFWKLAFDGRVAPVTLSVAAAMPWQAFENQADIGNAVSLRLEVLLEIDHGRGGFVEPLGEKSG